MFDALRKKLSSLFTKEEPKKAKKAKKTKEKKSKSKPIKEKAKKAKTKAKEILPKQKETQAEIALVKEEIKEAQESESESAQSAEEEIEAQEEDKEELLEEEAKEAGVSEEELKEEQPKKEGFFARFAKKLTSGHTISKEEFDEIFQELEITLLENNVALEVVDQIRESLSKSIIGQQIKKDQFESKLLESLKASILEVLIEPPDFQQLVKSKSPYTILFFGINGTGKTTSIAKIANMLKKQGISCVLAAADTFRAASIEQLKVHADRIGVPIVAHDYGSDPASVAFDAIAYAKKNHIQVVLIDTAGRMYTKANLLKEMEKIIKVSKPDLKIFVGESITGNDATEQAKTFNETAGIDGIILSKADIDEKAGTILSVSYVTKKPIFFLGTGQAYKDLETFTKNTVLKNLGLN